MKVDFDNLRLQACYSYDRLVRLLNDNHDKDFDKVYIHVDELQEEIDELRMLITSIACCYSEKDGFKSVLPDTGLAYFNQS